MTILVSILLALCSLVGILLTILTLPGTWLIFIAALLVQLAVGDLYSWWTLGSMFALALLAEAVEFFASAIGAARFGAGRAGAIGSIAGSLAGALVGTFAIPIPILGTVLGGVIGAGAGALIAERSFARRSWGDSLRIGHGAATGRLVATVFKIAAALVMGVVLTLAPLV